MDFDAFVRGDGLPHETFEYVDGYAIEFPMIRYERNDLADWIIALGRFAFRSYGFCGSQPFGIRMPQGNVRLPDVFFWSKAQNEQRKTHYLDGPVDLVIEIVSPSTRTIDYTDKYDEYQTAGCREYWILDPKTGRHSFFVLDAETKSYRPLATVTDDADREFIRSTTVPDLWFDLSWFADRPAEQDVVATWQAAKGSAA